MKVDFPELAGAVFTALRGRGLVEAQIASAIAATPAHFKALEQGKRQLTDRAMARLEDLADRTVGQLGMEGFRVSDPALRRVMDSCAELRDVLKDKSAPRRKRQG